MSTVYAKFEKGREWVMLVERVPLAAVRIQDCQSRFVQLRDGGAQLEAGSVVVECLRNDKGVQAAIVLPNGFVLPTGRMGAAGVWFPMLKSHLRQWLAMSAPGRIVRIVGDGLRTFEKEFQAGNLTEEVYRQTVAKLESLRHGALGELPTGVNPDDVLDRKSVV